MNPTLFSNQWERMTCIRPFKSLCRLYRSIASAQCQYLTVLNTYFRPLHLFENTAPVLNIFDYTHQVAHVTRHHFPEHTSANGPQGTQFQESKVSLSYTSARERCLLHVLDTFLFQNDHYSLRFLLQWIGSLLDCELKIFQECLQFLLSHFFSRRLSLLPSLPLDRWQEIYNGRTMI